MHTVINGRYYTSRVTSKKLYTMMCIYAYQNGNWRVLLYILIVQRSSISLLLSLLLCSGQCRAQSDSRSRSSSSSNFIDEEDEEDGVMWPTLTISPHHHDDDQQQEGGSKYSGPFFEPVFPTNLSVLAGQTVVLQCRVMDLGDRVVLYTYLCKSFK